MKYSKTLLLIIMIASFINIKSNPLLQALELSNILAQSATPAAPDTPPHTPGTPAGTPKPTKVPRFILTLGDLMKGPWDAIVNPANSSIQGGTGVDGMIVYNNDPQTNVPFIEMVYDKTTQTSKSKLDADGKQIIRKIGDVSGSILKQLKILLDAQKTPIAINSKNLPYLPEGEAVITQSGSIINQNAKTIRYVIATVGPRGPANDDKNQLLYNAYYKSVALAANAHGNAVRLLNIIQNGLGDNYPSNPIKSIAFPSISTGIFAYPLDRATKKAIEACVNALIAHPDTVEEVRIVILPKEKDTYDQYVAKLQKLAPNYQATNTQIELITDEQGTITTIYTPNNPLLNTK